MSAHSKWGERDAVNKDWQSTRLKFIAPSPRKILPSRPKGTRYLGLENIESGTGKLLLESEQDQVDSSVVSFSEHSVLFGKLRPYLAKVATPDFSGVASTEIMVFEPKGETERRFLSYALLSDEFIGRVSGMVDGAKMPRANPEGVLNLRMAIPHLHKQRRIADYLDAATGKIDRLVALRRRQMELLQEQRAALIQQAVTRGLDPNAPLKDSGIPWLGKIPRHWVLTRIKRESKLISKGTTPSTIGSDFIDAGVRFLKAENICDGTISGSPEFFISDETHRELFRSQLQPHDLLVVIAGATTGKSGVLPVDLTPANLNQAVSFIRFRSIPMSRFCHEWLETSNIQEFIRQLAVQSAQPNLSMQDLGNIPIVSMPNKELEDLLEKIQTIKCHFGRLLTAYARQIELLGEYRAALIHEAVTGKKAV